MEMCTSVFVSVLVCFYMCVSAYVFAFIHVCGGMSGCVSESLCLCEWLGVCASVFHDSMTVCFCECVCVLMCVSLW